MKKLNDYLNEGAEVLGGTGRLCEELEFSRASLTNARKRGSMSEERCVALAKVIDCDPREIIGACYIARHPEEAKYWGRWIAATVIMSVAAGLIFSFENNSLLSVAALDPVYIMRSCAYLFVSVMAFLYLYKTIAIDYSGGSKSTG